LKISEINGIPCSLLALLDTGSPVSLIKSSVLKRFVGQNTKLDNPSVMNLKTINNVEVPVSGSKLTSIKLLALPNKSLSVNFQILDNDDWSTHAVLGRDFVCNNKLTILYKPTDNSEEKLKLFNEIASVNVHEIVPDKKDTKLSNLKTDFGHEADQRLLKIIQQVENDKVPSPTEEHYVKVNLKNESIYVFTPRRFAYGERLQMREIIDDLLRQEIIKPSKSPYCARVVPVRKRNGTLRLCIDLRPLNSRIVKQRYPFPLIEDCISRIGDKSVFTLLDLKDGFHHLKIYPEHTIYFAFATPDGQYEYLRLPFGFCEAPAEFQRRITQILQPLINVDKVVYIDDILIPSKTVEDNLETLKQTLLILKNHGFELNFEKCNFLRKLIEYLGYVITPSGITLSQRHIDAIEKFRTPTRVVELQRFLGLTNYFRNRKKVCGCL